MDEIPPDPEHDESYERWLRKSELSRPTGDLLDVEPAPADPNAPKTLSQLLQEDPDAHEY